MYEIDVREVDETTFEVTVSGRQETTHRVTVDPAYHEQLTGGAVPAAELVERSFEFLLEREPNTSILRRFDLPVIGSYFSEYETEIREMI